jgi:hypothetical protein
VRYFRDQFAFRTGMSMTLALSAFMTLRQRVSKRRDRPVLLLNKLRANLSCSENTYRVCAQRIMGNNKK